MLKSKRDRIAAWQAHSARFLCDHKMTELRKRTVTGGAFQCVQQCLLCGDPTTSPIAKTRAVELNGGIEPPPFDVALQQEWKQARTDSSDAIMKGDDSAFWTFYTAYLRSHAWAEKRRLVMKRAGGRCEGCDSAEATEVHHLTYEHVSAEFLFELVAVCDACHERLHAEELESPVLT